MRARRGRASVARVGFLDGANLHRGSPVVGGRCVRCGEPLSGNYWIVPGEYPKAEHERCRDFTDKPFAFARHVDVLRKASRHLDDDDARSVLEVATRLAALRWRWPAEALAVLVDGRALIAEVRPRLATLPAQLRADLG